MRLASHIVYDGKIVPKAWGYEFCSFDNGAAAVWILHIATKRRTSLHCHPNKKTTLVVLRGVVCITLITQHGGVTRLVEPLDPVVIDKGVYHQTEAVSALAGYPSAEDGAWLMEIEEPSNKGDLVRMEDAYGRAGQPYETEVVPYTGELLRLTHPGPQHFMGYKFSLFIPHEFHRIGKDGDFNLGSGVWLNIKKDSTVKLSNYVSQFVADLGVKHVFSVCGGGSMHLCDSFGKQSGIEYVATHHEQAASFAADAYARMSGIGCCLVTTGPGGTNAMTGVAAAWIDSTPVIFISGQVTRDTLLAETGLRQFGVQESDIVSLVTPITKYAVTVQDERDIKHILQKAAFFATTGRPGPVWIDIPLDIQSKQINPEELLSFGGATGAASHPALGAFALKAISMVQAAERPVMIVGNGVRLAKGRQALQDLINRLSIPVVSSWTAADMIADHHCHIGHCGIFGDRASNFAVQNADVLLVLGCRLSVPQMGYRADLFARGAKIIMVDIDDFEINKPSLKVELPIIADVAQFMGAALSCEYRPMHWDWLNRCRHWAERYPVVLPEYRHTEGGVNSFRFIEVLSEKLPKESIVVLDQGTAFTCTFQAAKMKLGQRWVAASGHAPMGYGLPGAVGAAFATGRKVICIVGDGAFQFNIQELQTIVHHKLPIIIFVINNGGYLTIKHMQENHFQHYVGSEAGSGVSFPDVSALAIAYKIRYYYIGDSALLEGDVARAIFDRGPCIVEVIMPKDQPLIPRTSSKKMPDGSIKSAALEDMFPFLPREEFAAQMIVPPVEALK